MIFYRYSSGRFPQAAGESVKAVAINAPLSITLFTVLCALTLFAMLGLAAIERMSLFSRDMTAPALTIVAGVGGVLPFLAAYAVASNRRLGRLLCFLQISGFGLLAGAVHYHHADALAWAPMFQLLAIAAPVTAAAWLWGPTRARYYFDVIAGGEPHSRLLSGTDSLPGFDLWWERFGLMLEWAIIAISLFVAFGGFWFVMFH